LPQGQQQKPSECDAPLPDSSTVRQNVRGLDKYTGDLMTNPRAAEAALFVTFGTWLGRVAPGGSWDYKLQPGGTERNGNFNFGATGSLLFDSRTLLSGAGVVQLLTLPSASDGGVPFVSPPYGDQIKDQNDIKAGIAAGCR
jgi:Bacterial toxin 44